MLGIHIRKEGTLSESIKAYLPKYMKVAQVFVVNPMSGNNTTRDDDIAAIKQMRDKMVIAHGSYVDIPWSSKSIDLIHQEIKICYKAGIRGLIIHLGAKTNENIKPVLDKLLKIKSKYLENLILFLEINSMKQSDKTFETPNKINKLFAVINEQTKGSALLIGLCIDTAHLWACGTSLTTYKSTEVFLSALDPSVPIMFHLNDSTEPFASGKDIHTQLCEGEIWREKSNDLSDSGIACIVNYAKKNNSIIILERRGNDQSYYKKDISILKKLGLI
jgi:endonuclease IV